MKLHTGDTLELELLERTPPTIKLHIDDGWEGVSSILSIEEAKEVRRVLTRMIRAVDENLTRT